MARLERVISGSNSSMSDLQIKLFVTSIQNLDAATEASIKQNITKYINYLADNRKEEATELELALVCPLSNLFFRV